MSDHNHLEAQPQHAHSSEVHTHHHGEHPHEEHGHTHHHQAHSNDAHDHAHPHVEDAHNHHEHDAHVLEHEHSHDHKDNWLAKFIPFLHGHSHGDVQTDTALETSKAGIKTLKLSLLILLSTAVFQVVIVAISGSVALLADTIHNFSDALTAIPLWIAFSLSRRSANRRYTYGYGKLEDVAGVAIVLMIFLSALVAAYESYQKIINPQPLNNLGWVIAASIIGFIGNEVVATLRIRTGREIGSAALIADGQHARVDGLTSLAVVLGALGVLAGFPLADPIVGLLITVTILFIVKDSAKSVWLRLTDGVEPELVERLEQTATKVAGVLKVTGTRVRWHGHKLLAELEITVDGQLSTRDSHYLAEQVSHKLIHSHSKLARVYVHVDPAEALHENHHALTAHHYSLY